MATPRSLLTFTCALALSATASAQTLPRDPLPLPAQQPDIKTPAPAASVPVTDAGRPIAAASEVSDVAAPQLASLPLGIDLSVVRYQDGPDGSLWARGRNYKMRFDATSATFVPFFSSRAPRNFDVAFELEGVHAGARSIELLDAAAVARDGDSVSLDRGAVDEVYELGLDQVEQKFVIESLPEPGDVVIDLGVRTELCGSSEASGFTFANEWGRVTYSRATAVDAVGHELELESSLDGDAIRIIVPAAFAAGAKLPLTIDPLVVAYGVDTSTSTAFSADSAYDLSGGGVLHIYNVYYSANDYDVGGYATDRTGNVWFGSFFWNDFTSAHWVRPRVAHNGQTDRFLVVAQVGQPGNREIWGQVRSVWSNSFMIPTVLSGPEAGEKTNVDVGGDPYPIGASYYLIVYERTASAADHDIHARLIGMNGAPAGASIFVDNTSGTLDVLPSISKSNGAHEWLIAWQRNSFNKAILGARVNWQGPITNPTFTIVNNGLPHSRPSASSPLYGTDRYLVAAQKEWGTDNDIMLFGVNGGTVPAQFALSEANYPTLFFDQSEPAVDSDGAHFLVAFSELQPGSATNYDMFASEIQWNTSGLILGENRMVLASSQAREGDPQVCCHESSAPSQSTNDYTVIFDRGIDPTVAGSTPDVVAVLARGQTGGWVTSFCDKYAVTCPCGVGIGPGQCPNSAFASGAHMTATGNASTTNDTLVFQITSMRPNSVFLVFQGDGLLNGSTGLPFGDGVRCVGGVTRRFPAMVSSGSGSSSYPQTGQPSISSAGSVPQFGGTYYYQAWYRDSAAFCTPGTTNMSDGLKVVWTP